MEENDLRQQPTTTIKIALYGPESTGKTTLAKKLATHFDTLWTPEFARKYLQQKFDSYGTICEPEDLMPIAVGQTQLENEALLTANRFLFSDTCLLVTKVYSDIYYNFCDPALEKAARKHKYDLFFLTDIDVPWEKDDLRDRPDDREQMFLRFKQELILGGKPFITLSGNMDERIQNAIVILQNLVKAKEMGFSSHDFVQMHEQNIQPATIKRQIEILSMGISKAVLDRPATKGDGIVKLTEPEFEKAAEFFDHVKDRLKLKKFVPASGAASRMFKFLSEFLNEYHPEETINAYINRKDAAALRVFLTGLEKFPFFNFVDHKLHQLYPDFNSWESDRKSYELIKILLDPDHFDFCSKPKGILPFHKYPSHIATPIEEHLNESAFYGSSCNRSNLHFTISAGHQKQFQKIISTVRKKVEEETGNTIQISYSYQDKSTDTIAVNPDNTPFRKKSGELFFRPGGHGALIENLNNLDADIIFIKNIDNVIQNHIESIALYKKALAGKLVKMQDEIFGYLKQIENKMLDEQTIETIIRFADEELNICIIDDFTKYTTENKIAYIEEILDRPIRVCGMVKNEGEPGGGPFWIRDRRGNLSLQIVETSQIDLQNQSQVEILSASTHFNPVDIVCAIKNYKGQKFNLHEFVDHNSGFIAQKFKEGRELKAYELPGLWNGAMAHWITVFIEVPLLTFNPVKTVNDLLKPAHQPQ